MNEDAEYYARGNRNLGEQKILLNANTVLSELPENEDEISGGYQAQNHLYVPYEEVAEGGVEEVENFRDRCDRINNLGLEAQPFDVFVVADVVAQVNVANNID